jgi:hypothetical protein
MMTHRKQVNLIFAAVIVATAAILILPAAITNAMLHHRLTRVHRGMTQEAASDILRMKPVVTDVGIRIEINDRNSPLAGIFPIFENCEHHVVKFESNRVTGVGIGHYH